MSEPLIPTIYADGEHDDTAGIVAMMADDYVAFDGEVYPPGRALFIDGKRLILTKKLEVLGLDADGRPGCEENAGVVYIQRLNSVARAVTVTNCFVDYRP